MVEWLCGISLWSLLLYLAIKVFFLVILPFPHEQEMDVGIKENHLAIDTIRKLLLKFNFGAK